MIKQKNDYNNLEFDKDKKQYILPNGSRISEEAYLKGIHKDVERRMGKS